MDDPLAAIDWPRADFRVGTLEFLIGLLATACPPETDRAWRAWWREPPSAETLAAAFAPLAHAFELDGDGPRFMQDLEDLPGQPDLPETLLIEAPGEATRRNNTALLVKPDRIVHLSRPAAAMALFTLQTYAPAGGRGNLTSLRGGGPLTTLALPGAVPLWLLLWANVPKGPAPAPGDLPRIFPWLAPTRTADRYPATIPGRDAHALQAFWGMPRRIRLDFAANVDALPCDLTGTVDEVIATGWRQRPNGVKYAGWDHPLSPAYKDTKGGGWLPVHPQPGGIGYRHWVGFVFGDAKTGRSPADCVAAWHERASDVPAPVRDGMRLLAAGYDMDNMKARAFVESEMPLPGTGDPEAGRAIARLAEGLVASAEAAARALRRAVRDARFDDDTALDAAPIAAAFESFWAATHDAFFTQLAHPPEDTDEALEAASRKWLAVLKATALRLFDEAAPLDPGAASFDPARIVRARRSLFYTLEGYGPSGNALFAALMLPTPEPAKKGGKRAKAEMPA